MCTRQSQSTGVSTQTEKSAPPRFYHVCFTLTQLFDHFGDKSKFQGPHGLYVYG